jgi:aryl-alcohol dehydrogenase-like predicted oxidoreductase
MSRTATGTTPATGTATAAASGTFTLGGDLTVHRLGFGAMQITGPGVWGPPADRDEAVRVLRRAVDLGVDLIDTADAYGPHVSEELIAEALYPYPAGLAIATKGGLVRPGPGRWVPVGRPAYLRQQVEMSLRRLRLDRIDLYQLHRIDPDTPVEDSLGELRALQREGKIRQIGLSNVRTAELAHARTLVDVASVQNRYNLVDRASEDVLDYATGEGIGFIPWFPVATGRLARPGGPLDAVARRHRATPAQLALAWLLRRSPVVLPIPGTSSVAHLEENVAAAGVALTDAEFTELAMVTDR